MVMLTEEDVEQTSAKLGPASPQSLGGTSTILELYVDDVDAAYKRAVEAGATPTCPVMDTFWGGRYGWVTDDQVKHWLKIAYDLDV